MIGALLSLFSGCSEKLAEPTKEPGMSLELRYPVLLVGERNLIVKNDEASLITTSVANGGVYYASYTFIDSARTEYVVKKATAIGQKSVWMDMGTSRFKVFLEMKSKGRIGLEQAKAMALAAATTPDVAVTGAHGKEIATSKIGRAKTFSELIEACRDPWAPKR